MNSTVLRPSLRDLFKFQSLTNAQVTAYEEQGFLNVGRVLTDRGLEQLRTEAMLAWEREKGPVDPSKTWLHNALLSNIHRMSDTARQFYFSGPLVDIASRLIGPNIKGATSQLTFKMRGNDKPFAWHQDNGYGQLDPCNTLTALTALDDADEENGCLWLIPGSHQEGQIDVSDQFGPQEKAAGAAIETPVDESRAVPMPMRAGESLIFHCWMLHKSDGNLSKERDRRILFLRYADADAVEVYNHRQPRLGKLLRGRTRFAEVQQYEAELALV